MPAKPKPTPKLVLVLAKPRFVSASQLADADLLQPDQDILTVSQTLFDHALSLGEAHGWKPPTRQLKCRAMPPASVNLFVRAVRAGLQAVPEPDARPRPSGHLQAFFAAPSRRRALDRLLEFLDRGGDLSVEG